MSEVNAEASVPASVVAGLLRVVDKYGRHILDLTEKHEPEALPEVEAMVHASDDIVAAIDKWLLELTL